MSDNFAFTTVKRTLLLLTITSVGLAAGSGSKCEALLSGKTAKLPKGQALVIRPETSPYHEFTYIRHGHSQNPKTEFISSAYIGDYSYHQDIAGDTVRAEIYPFGNPFDKRNQQPQIANQNSSNPYQLQYNGYRNQSPRQQLPAVASTNSALALSQSEKRQLVEKHIDALYGNRFDADSRELVIKTTMNSAELMAEVMAARPNLANSKKEILSNVGLDRYFWFQPETQSQLMPARVLDMHRYVTGGFTVLVEYVSSNNSHGMRVRNVLELSVNELKTFTRSYEKSAETAQQEFFDTLSPLEVETQKLARALKVKLFGFNSFGRTPGQDSDRFVSTPLQMMNNISWLAMQKSIEDAWGKVDHLKSPEEKQMGMFNVIDVFSRLDPKFVLHNYKKTNFEYTWVITEDGQLKVVPKMPLGNNLKPQLLRLSGGRKIFGGGSFTFNADGSLNVTRDSNGFQNIDSAWGSHDAFEFENQNLDQFISAVFAIQGQVEVSKINSKRADSYFYQSSGEPDINRAGSKSANQNRNTYDGFESEAAYDFVRNMRARGAAKVHDDPVAELTWDRNTGIPLFIDEWIKASGLPASAERDQNTLVKWAHYVLQTDHNMKWDEIKKASRKLNSQFFLKANEDKKAQAAQQAINRAIAVLEEIMK